MVLGDAILKPKLVEQLVLVPPLPTHHRPVLRRQSPQPTESPFGATLNAFIDSIGHSLTLQRGIDMIRDVAEADTASSPTRPLGAARNPSLGSY